MKSLGFDDLPLRWMTSYLHGRSICTNVERSISSCRGISSGVPQGSVLGPLLFVLYVSDLPSFVSSSSCAMFADDSLLYNTTCSASAPNSSKPPPACCPLQEDASRVQSWADQWNTLFHAAKSSHMIISRSPVHSSPSITLHDNYSCALCYMYSPSWSTDLFHSEIVCTCGVSVVSCMLEGCSIKAPSLSLLSVPAHLFFFIHCTPPAVSRICHRCVG